MLLIPSPTLLESGLEGAVEEGVQGEGSSLLGEAWMVLDEPVERVVCLLEHVLIARCGEATVRLEFNLVDANLELEAIGVF